MTISDFLKKKQVTPEALKPIFENKFGDGQAGGNG